METNQTKPPFELAIETFAALRQAGHPYEKCLELATAAFREVAAMSNETKIPAATPPVAAEEPALPVDFDALWPQLQAIGLADEWKAKISPLWHECMTGCMLYAIEQAELLNGLAEAETSETASVAEIVARMRTDLKTVGGLENGMIGIPAFGVLEYVEHLEAAISTAASVASATASVPAGIVDRIEAALKRIEDGHGIRRIPADPTDPDLVLAECKAFFQGRKLPFWIKPSTAAVQAEPAELTRDYARALDSINGHVEHIKRLEQRVRELTAFKAMVNRHRPEFPADPDGPRDVWYWQGDGEDHLESMVHQMPIVIRAEQLRDLLALAATQPQATEREALSAAVPSPAPAPVPVPDLGSAFCGYGAIVKGEYKLASMCSNAVMSDGELHPLYTFSNEQIEQWHAARQGQAPAVTHGWQPIETAPKARGVLILLFGDGPAIQSCSMVGSWSDDGWSEFWMLSPGNTVFQPTHWMPLPAAPTFDVPV